MQQGDDKPIDWDRISCVDAHLMVQRNERLIRSLLSRWVSELEPAIAYDRQGNVIGITPANSPIGSKPFVLTVD